MIKNFNDFVNENLTSLVDRYKNNHGIKKEDEITEDYVLSFLHKNWDDLCKEIEIIYNGDTPIVNITGGFAFKQNIIKDGKLPFRFGKVTGNFSCSFQGLTTLDGCPTEVGGDFACSYNKLTSLEGCPTEVGRDFSCDGNQLTSLEGCPKKIIRDFDCSFNQISSLDYCPTEVGGKFDCTSNMLGNITPEDVRKICKIGGRVV